MTTTPGFDVKRILILKEDKFSAGMIMQLARETFPAVHCEVVQQVAAASATMAAEAVDLWLTGVVALDGDVLDFLAACSPARRCFRHVLVVTARRELRTLLDLRTLPIGGVFDLREEEPARLKDAMISVISDRPYWSPGVLVRLRQHLTHPDSFSKLLTPVEQMVFAVIGTGMDDHAAAERLGMKPSTVHSVRRQLHHKLGLQHKGDLVRAAVQYGFVRFTPDCVLQPGFAILRDNCRPGSKSRKAQPSPRPNPDH